MHRDVLLVDDQPAFLQMARSLLSGHPEISVVGEATSGAEALALLPNVPLEAVILDVQMPSMNGFETARRLLAVSPSLRVILVSSYDDAEYDRLARAVGAAGFLPKKALSADAIVDILQRP